MSPEPLDDPPPGPRPLVNAANGTHDQLSDRKAQADVPAGTDAEQALAESDLTISDSDQTLSDADQTSSDRDQTSADTDQLAADRDQIASDRDLAHGVDPVAHEVSREIRERTAIERQQTAGARLDSAAQRDATAHARDIAALARDQASAARDLARAQRDGAYEQELSARALTGSDDRHARAAEARKQAAWHRARAAEQRVLAAQDRAAAAADREASEHDRRQALADREAIANDLVLAETDPLTGARMRRAGLSDLDNELDRCRRTDAVLAVVFIDVVGRKRVNDNQGHGAGDELLKLVVARIRARLRPYDLIIRVGGDEFLCAMSNMTVSEARARFSQIAAALAASPGGAAIRTGFAELADEGDDAAALVARADAQLLKHHA